MPCRPRPKIQCASSASLSSEPTPPARGSTRALGRLGGRSRSAPGRGRAGRAGRAAGRRPWLARQPARPPCGGSEPRSCGVRHGCLWTTWYAPRRGGLNGANGPLTRFQCMSIYWVGWLRFSLLRHVRHGLAGGASRGTALPPFPRKWTLWPSSDTTPVSTFGRDPSIVPFPAHLGRDTGQGLMLGASIYAYRQTLARPPSQPQRRRGWACWSCGWRLRNRRRSWASPFG